MKGIAIIFISILLIIGLITGIILFAGNNINKDDSLAISEKDLPQLIGDYSLTNFNVEGGKDAIGIAYHKSNAYAVNILIKKKGEEDKLSIDENKGIVTYKGKELIKSGDGDVTWVSDKGHLISFGDFIKDDRYSQTKVTTIDVNTLRYNGENDKLEIFDRYLEIFNYDSKNTLEIFG